MSSPIQLFRLIEINQQGLDLLPEVRMFCRFGSLKIAGILDYIAYCFMILRSGMDLTTFHENLNIGTGADLEK